MMDLKAEQQKLYRLLSQNARCFVRVCEDDHALWVSDFPRLNQNCDDMAKKLLAEGFLMQLCENGRLCFLDLTMRRWQEKIAQLPKHYPSFPHDAEFLEAFALCRLWMRHPAEMSEAHLPAVRQVYKQMDEDKPKMYRTVKELYEEAAMQLRKGETVAHDGGWLLAEWLFRNESKEVEQ